MTKPISEVCERWVQGVMGLTDRPNLSHPRVIAGHDAIKVRWNAEILRVVRDRKMRPIRFLLNGDRVRSGGWGSTDYTWYARLAVRGVDLPRVTIPFSALEAAGIDKDSVEIIDVIEDGHETIYHEVFEAPEGATWVTKPRSDYVDFTDEEIEAILDERHASAVAGWESSTRYASQPGAGAYWTKWLSDHPTPPERETRDDLSIHQTRQWREVGIQVTLDWDNPYRSGESDYQIDVEALPDGRVKYSWETFRHWLGESLIRAKVPTIHYKACLACGGTGSSSRLRDRAWCIECRGKGGKEFTRNRTAYFLSGFDKNELRPSYFFCELPKGAHPTTIEEAYEALKPETVKLAEQLGREVKRQGDIFAVSVPTMDKASLRNLGAKFQRMGMLFGTNHRATEVAYLKDMTLARGILWHKPLWRTPDHRRVHLGSGWWVIVKNTVPVTKRQ